MFNPLDTRIIFLFSGSLCYEHYELSVNGFSWRFQDMGTRAIDQTVSCLIRMFHTFQRGRGGVLRPQNASFCMKFSITLVLQWNRRCGFLWSTYAHRLVSDHVKIIRKTLYCLSTLKTAFFNRTGPVFCLLLRVSSDYAQPIKGQVTEVTWPVIGRAQPDRIPSKRQKTGPDYECLRWNFFRDIWKTNLSKSIENWLLVALFLYYIIELTFCNQGRLLKCQQKNGIHYKNSHKKWMRYRYDYFLVNICILLSPYLSASCHACLHVGPHELKCWNVTYRGSGHSILLSKECCICNQQKEYNDKNTEQIKCKHIGWSNDSYLYHTEYNQWMDFFL